MATDQTPRDYCIWSRENDAGYSAIHICKPGTPDDALTTDNLDALPVGAVAYPIGIADDGLPLDTQFPLFLLTTRSEQSSESLRVIESTAIIPTKDKEMFKRSIKIILECTHLEKDKEAIEQITEKLQPITDHLIDSPQTDGYYTHAELREQFHLIAPSYSVQV